MKKVISLVAALVMLALQIPSTALAADKTDYTQYFPGRDEITCVAIGGSITEAGGVTLSWGKYFSDWLSSQTGKKVNFYNKGVGGTDSSYGLVRLYSDVSSLEPDIVFVEFSVNDRNTHTEHVEEAPGQDLIPKQIPMNFRKMKTAINILYITVTNIHISRMHGL